MAKIIILGASGFIGGSLYAHFLSEEKYDVKGFSSRECNLLSLASINNSLSSLPADSAIIMASAIPRIKGDSFDAMMKNITMAENVSRFLEVHKANQFIFLSTADVYGKADGAKISESLMPMPDTYYGISKLCSEIIIRNCCSKYKLPLLILRLPGIYGPNDKRKSTIGKLIESALKGKVTVFGNGREKRDFVYAEDVCRIIKIAIEKNIGATLNLATGKSHTIMEIIEIIKSNFPHGFGIVHKNISNMEARDKVYDISLLNKLFPDFKFTGIKEGIDLYIKTIH